MDTLLSPLTQVLKQNSRTVNLVLLGLTILFLFPLNHFLPYDIKGKVETELRTLMDNPWIMTMVSVLIFAVFQTGNMNMLVLLLFLVHYLSSHK